MLSGVDHSEKLLFFLMCIDIHSITFEPTLHLPTCLPKTVMGERASLKKEKKSY